MTYIPGFRAWQMGARRWHTSDVCLLLESIHSYETSRPRRRFYRSKNLSSLGLLILL